MGIMGSFLVSNFSLDVVTQSPWVLLNEKQRLSVLDDRHAERIPSHLPYSAQFTTQSKALS
jgi:hypothetical protein